MGDLRAAGIHHCSLGYGAETAWMRCARPAPPRTTKATVRFGSSLSPPVTSLAAALTAALVAEPASGQQGCCRCYCCCSIGKLPSCVRKAPGAGRGLFVCTAMLRNRLALYGCDSNSLVTRYLESPRLRTEQPMRVVHPLDEAVVVPRFPRISAGFPPRISPHFPRTQPLTGYPHADGGNRALQRCR